MMLVLLRVVVGCVLLVGCNALLVSVLLLSWCYRLMIVVCCLIVCEFVICCSLFGPRCAMLLVAAWCVVFTVRCCVLFDWCLLLCARVMVLVVCVRCVLLSVVCCVVSAVRWRSFIVFVWRW